MNNPIRFISLLLFLSVFSAACSPSPEQIATPLVATLNAIPTQTAYATLTSYPTYTPFPTMTAYPTYTPYSTLTPRIVIVTVTSTATPIYTPTETLIPTATTVPTNTKDPTMADKIPGFYLVNSEIAPGLWRSLGTGDDCYWEINTRTGDIIDNHFGIAGITMYVTSSAFSVRLDSECGDWTYLGP
ncbi:MAG: hypothetical protein LLG42_15585 [Chloroflexi bacterium]|nr:hypothetical protein [Chloroflexota bacterium]